MALNGKHNDDNMAVVLRNARKSYDKGTTYVLDKLNMYIPRGCIYGLLGASGCGKTTLLNVVVGLLKLDSGEVKVLGGTPGKKNSGVPGPRVGYMPQEPALVEEFSVKDAIYYFGWLYGMTKDDLEARFEFLSNLLDLPPASRIVKDLSGGQLRRLSFAVAIVQSPEILILDEPTVGQDPVLRLKIWNYLLKLSNEDNVTIVITTHYIAEAKDAHRVGLLRNGVFLAETSPNNLLTHLNCATLEDVSLLLSQRQTDKNDQVSEDNNQIELSTMNTMTSEELMEEDFAAKPYKVGPSERLKSSAIARMKALLFKNFVKLFWNIPGLMFIFGFPLIHCGCFFVALGDITLVPIGIVNNELGNCRTLPGGLQNHSSVKLLGEDNCRLKGLSCLYIDQINTNKVDIVYYNTLEEGIRATVKGRTYSTLYFQPNFTESMQVRQDDAFAADNASLDASAIGIWMDMSDYNIGNGLKLHFLDSYKELLEHIADQCNLTKKAASIPLKINEPIHGVIDASFSSFSAPGFVLSVIAFMTTTFSATVILMEKTEGVWNRNLVAGVTTAEILLSHFFTQLFVMIIQMIEVLTISAFVYNGNVVGNVWIAVGLMFMQGLCGNGLGLVISSVASSVTMAYTASLGSFFPTVILCGIVWPIEAMPYVLRIISLCLPSTWACMAARNVLLRGYGLFHASVYPGFLIPFAWILLFGGVVSFSLSKNR